MHEQRPERERKLYQTVLARGFPSPKQKPVAAAGKGEVVDEPRVPRISATVIVRNEAHLLEGCLEGLSWCDEIVVLDMQSRDGSAELARAMGAKVHSIEPCVIAEPARLLGAELATNDWLLLIDPDEHMPPGLARDIQQAIRAHPKAGAFKLPLWYYFKGQPLQGTVWGGRGKTKWALVHRRRVELLPQCNRLGRVLPGFDEVTLEARDDNTIRHYWSDSYCKLLYKHLVRYARLEAQKMHEDGQRWSWRLGVVEPWREFIKCFRHMDGWRMGVRGWVLSGIYGAYVVAYCWILALYGLGLLRTNSPASLRRAGLVCPRQDAQAA